MVSVRVTEIYDLSTQVGKMGMVGIHTPGFDAASKLWDGLFKQYRYVRLASCDVAVACASTLPADPLQVGVEAGDIAPQDMFNPILYKAVSNDSFNRVLNRVYALNPVTAGLYGSLGSVDAGDFAQDESTPEWNFELYYGLLADTDGWKKAMPQAGFSMKGLYPMVYQVVNTFGNQYRIGDVGYGGNDLDNVPTVTDAGSVATVQDKAVTFRGHAMKMPRLPTKSVYGASAGATLSDQLFPKTYVACFIVPPAKLHKFYYRMRVTWTLEFEELRPSTDVGTMSLLDQVGSSSYGTDYVEQSKKMPEQTDAVDGNGVSIEKVMTSGK